MNIMILLIICNKTVITLVFTIMTKIVLLVVSRRTYSTTNNRNVTHEGENSLKIKDINMLTKLTESINESFIKGTQ